MSFTVFRFLADGTKEETDPKALFDERDALRARAERAEARVRELENGVEIYDAEDKAARARIAALEGALRHCIECPPEEQDSADELGRAALAPTPEGEP